VPEETILAGALQSSADGERAIKGNFQPLEQWISGTELAGRLDRTMAKLADVDL
jgi:hypothetical protein